MGCINEREGPLAEEYTPAHDTLPTTMANQSQQPQRLISKFRGVLMGSGAAAFTEKHICQTVVNMLKKDVEKPVLVYLGTALYDIEKYERIQTDRFKELGWTVISLRLACKSADLPSWDFIEKTIEGADIILVSGGNTMWAVDRWKFLKVDKLLRAAAERGTLMCGGSAGAMCWFDSGHTDSGDPESFRDAVLYGNLTTENAEWEHVRVELMGLLPGLCCPHFDLVLSNGVVRARDLEKLMRRLECSERAVCLDHFAGLVIENSQYKVISFPERRGSVLPNLRYTDDRSKGHPGVWLLDLVDGEVKYTLAPKSGKLTDLLREPDFIKEDPRCEKIRKLNSVEI